MDELNARLKSGVFQQNRLKKQKLSGLLSVLESLSPLKVLSRGYCLVSRDKKLIKQAQELKKGEEIYMRFSQSFALAHVISTGLLSEKDKETNIK